MVILTAQHPPRYGASKGGCLYITAYYTTGWATYRYHNTCHNTRHNTRHNPHCTHNIPQPPPKLLPGTTFHNLLPSYYRAQHSTTSSQVTTGHYIPQPPPKLLPALHSTTSSQVTTGHYIPQPHPKLLLVHNTLTLLMPDDLSCRYYWLNTQRMVGTTT